ncbi:alkaline phosphatase family protein [Asticcacaulis solisilvae]|uniref:alkaline phosphatase family protein n=1 Tax=Asticcacaulis solisilvae TaxID=1217274 RepID=UPI003FD701F4
MYGACAEAKAPAPLIIVSIDAFRADFYDRGLTPNLKALSDAGTHAVIHPSFPSLTFPNHYTLVTGKRPDHHGMVANYMYDASHPADPKDADAAHFTKAKAADGFWWQEAKPVWVSAEQNGIRSGAIFWPGTQAEIDHTRPALFLDYDKTATSNDRVDKLLAWMDLPPEQRPGLSLLYLDEVDVTGHKYGPDSPEIDAAIAEADAAVGRLVSGLKARGIVANIIVVSDHGLTSVSPDRVYIVSDLIGRGGLPADAKADPRYDMIYWGSLGLIRPMPGSEALFDTLTKTHFDHMQCYHRRDIPAHYRYGKNPRVTEIVCIPELGWQVAGLRIDKNLGNHGYDPAYSDMNAIFVAGGPNIRQGAKLKPFDNVDVYDAEMTLLHLKPEPNDGTIAPVKPALRP